MSEEKREVFDTSVNSVSSNDHQLETARILRTDKDADIAMSYATEGVVIDEATNRRILRKIDLCLGPLMCILYACQFMDKVSNSYASVMGLREDLNMVGDMYSWTGTSFYLGYLAFVFPASYMLQRLPVIKTVGTFIIIWGVLLCLHSVPQYAGFIALRTLLGMMESAVTPAFVIITSQWYKKEEQFLRTSCWFAFNGIGAIMGSGIAYGLAIRDNYTIHAWKLVFIITGCITIFLGFVTMLHVPDTPTQAWFLTAEEKVLVVERIRSNNQGFGNRKIKTYQIKEALTDLQTWLFVLFAISNNIPNGGLTNFSAILLSEDFGYSKTTTLLMNMPTGAVEVVGCIALAYTVRWFKHRMVIALIAQSITLMCSCLLAFAGPKNARLAGYYTLYIFPIGMICALSCFASNTAGHTKKVTTNATYLVAYCVGNLIGPQTFITSQAPSYSGAKIAIVVNQIAGLILLAAIYYVYWRRNIAKDKLEKVSNEHLEFADLTDKENPNFRYSC
ncbi:BA75_01250T0 [Komagataella pastoris]|uniref:BA75_01250T0 n=1 Tax=Komagataella pastoris TaxID=4922 RepID=A0A1B2J6Y9_PICPA|nr:BA75_01250T0 [Komagataella pastoris]